MKNTGLYLVILVLCLFGCQSENKGSLDNVIHLEEVWNTEGSVMLSEIAGSIEYIPLQTSSDQESILPSANRINVKKAGDHFLTYGRETLVKVFSSQGEFIRSIGSMGKGPGEYMGVTKVLVSNNGKEIWIFDSNSGRLINYSMDGILLNERIVERSVAQISIDPDENIYLMHLEYDRSMMDSSKIEVINQAGETIDQFSLYKGRRLGPGRRWLLYNRLNFNNGAIEHFEPPYDTLYRYEDKNWKPIWVLDIGQNKIPFEAYTDNSFNEIFQPYSFISSLLETSDYFFIRGVHKQSSKMILADKKSLHAQNCDYVVEKLERPYLYQGLINDIDGGVPFWPRSSYKNEYLISFIEPMNLIDFEPALGDPSSFSKTNRERLDHLMKIVDPEGNPIVMLVKLK